MHRIFTAISPKSDSINSCNNISEREYLVESKVKVRALQITAYCRNQTSGTGMKDMY